MAWARIFKVGLGVFSNFGLGMSYDSGWVGRYYAQNNTLIGLTIMPGLSYRINEQWSIGVAANVMVGYLNYSAAINWDTILNPNAPDGQMAMNDTTVGAGGNLGLLYEPKKGTRFASPQTIPRYISALEPPLHHWLIRSCRDRPAKPRTLEQGAGFGTDRAAIGDGELVPRVHGSMGHDAGFRLAGLEPVRQGRSRRDGGPGQP